MIYLPNYTEGNKINILSKEISWLNAQDARSECFMSEIPRQYQYINNGPIYSSVEFHPPNDFKGNIPNEWKQSLGDGSLFVMPAGMQNTHKHKIPKGDRKMDARISLTYRCWKKN